MFFFLLNGGKAAIWLVLKLFLKALSSALPYQDISSIFWGVSSYFIANVNIWHLKLKDFNIMRKYDEMIHSEKTASVREAPAVRQEEVAFFLFLFLLRQKHFCGCLCFTNQWGVFSHVTVCKKVMLNFAQLRLKNSLPKWNVGIHIERDSEKVSRVSLNDTKCNKMSCSDLK